MAYLIGILVVEHGLESLSRGRRLSSGAGRGLRPKECPRQPTHVADGVTTVTLSSAVALTVIAADPQATTRARTQQVNGGDDHPSTHAYTHTHTHTHTRTCATWLARGASCHAHASWKGAGRHQQSRWPYLCADPPRTVRRGSIYTAACRLRKGSSHHQTGAWAPWHRVYVANAAGHGGLELAEEAMGAQHRPLLC